MKQLVYFLLFPASLLFATPSAEDAVVKIYQTRNFYNYASPWHPPEQGMTRGSGFVISKNRILTNAHVIADAVFIQVKKPKDSKYYPAKADWIGHDCDLAILKVDDKQFFTNIPPLEFATEMAAVASSIKVLGYPMGGEELALTRGVVSRTEVCRYMHSGSALLCSQIDAPINQGNSGSPVLENGKVVGVAHQGIQSGQNIGYMIPIPIIHHFLKEVEKGKYDGFPKGNILLQSMENPTLRSFYQLQKGETGVLVASIWAGSPFEGTLVPGDVLLSIDGVSVGVDGTVDIGQCKSVSLFHLFSLKYYNDLVYLRVLRNGSRITLPMVLKYRPPKPLGEFEHDKRPTYFVLGGLVFQPLTVNYLSYALSRDMPVADLISYLKSGRVPADCSQVVVLTRVLPDAINVGYQSLSNEVVTSVNDVKVRNMRELVKLFKECTGSYYRIKLDNDMELILDRYQIAACNEKMKGSYYIDRDKSEDLN